MELQNAIYSRRSVRNFSDQPVEQEKLFQIIEAAMHAPSATNNQAWKYIVIDDKKIQQQISSMNGSAVKSGKDIITGAPTGILVLYRNDVSKNNKLYKDTIQSAAASIQNMLLMAHNIGLGACWICKLPLKGRLRKLLGIPKTYDIVAYISIGYPKKDIDEHTLKHFDNDLEKVLIRKRKYTMEEVLSYNRFQQSREDYHTYKCLPLVYILHIIQLAIKRDASIPILSNLLKKLLYKLGEDWA